VSLVMIAGLVLMAWKLGRTFSYLADAPDNSHTRTALADKRAANAAGELPLVSETDSAAERSPSVVAGLVATRLRAWEDDDEPSLRERRTEELEVLLGRSEQNEIAKRLKIITALPVALTDFAFGLPSFQQWMISEPKAAADWMSSHPAISGARLLTLFHNWGLKNRAELRQYLSALPESEWKQKAVAAASYEALPNDPAEAITWARQMKVGGPQTGILEMATVEWAKRDSVAAARWVNQVFDFALREHLVGSLAIGFAETDPALASKWLIDAVRPGDVRTRSIMEIVNVWAPRDPLAAADWIDRLSEAIPPAHE
jgi:hypothetical protein